MKPTSQVQADGEIDRVVTSFSSDWKFLKGNPSGAQNTSFNDSSWSSVTLPHTWNSQDGQDRGTSYYRADGWYRKHYTPDASLAGKRFFIQFDGALTTTDVYVNGTHVGEHRGGYAAFRFNITDYLILGSDNVIAVNVDNRPFNSIAPISGDFTFFGGLYRDVSMVITDPLHIATTDYGSSGVYITPSNVSSTSADIDINVKVSNDTQSSKDATVVATILNASNVAVATVSATPTIQAATTSAVLLETSISSPHLWHGRDDPYLYSVEVTVSDTEGQTDKVTQPLGIRSFSVDENTGFSLNGESYRLYGVNKHQDRRDKGSAVSQADQLEDMQMIEEIGATALRLAHYQHPEYTYDLADEMGFVIWAEIPLVNKIDGSTAFSDNVKQQLTELIRQNYNHPSIFFWSIANEVTAHTGPDPDTLLTELNTLAHTEDPTRLTVQGSCCGEDDPSHFFTDLSAFNEYLGWYGEEYDDFDNWADNIHTVNPTKSIGVSEYGAGVGLRIHAVTPIKIDHSEEYASLFHEAYWKAIKTRPFLWGTFIWNMFDFAIDTRHEGDTDGLNDKGLVSHDRNTKKDGFYWYKSNWTTDPMVHITEKRYDQRIADSYTVKVYSNTDSVELKKNGVSLGSKTSMDNIFTWPVTVSGGITTFEAIGTEGLTTVTDTMTWNVIEPPFTNIFINAGSWATYETLSGDFYHTERYSTGGTSVGTTSTTEITGTLDDPIGRSYRHGASFGFDIPIANGNYTVKLMFADPSCSTAGCRIFSVTSEGVEVISDLDVVQESGGIRTYLEKTFTTTVTGNQLDIDFTGSTGNAIINGIEIEEVVQATPTPTPTPTSAPTPTPTASPETLTWTQTDWSGGSGQANWSDSAKFNSSSGISTSTGGQITLSEASDWKYRRKITFDNSGQNEALTNFPVLVKLNSSRIDYSQTQNAGQDIRFTDSDGTTQLSYEIESWDESGDSYVWVKVPEIDATSNSDYIYMYYGNASASDAQSSTSVWDSNYQFVYHMKENPGGTAPQIQDSTLNNRDGTTVGSMASNQQVTGKVNGSIEFDAADDYIDSNVDAHFSSYTVEGWVKLDTLGETSQGRFVDKREGSGELFNIYFGPSTGTRINFARGFSTARGLWNTPINSLPLTSWAHITLTYDDNPAHDPKIYLNGISQTINEEEAPSGMATTNTDSYILGNRSTQDRTMDGFMDEFRFSNITRSADWITASYKTQNDTFNTYNSEEAVYFSSGTLTSSIFNAQGKATWGTIIWNEVTPTNTSITVKVRTSNSPVMGGATAFSSCDPVTSGSDISTNNCVTDGHHYIQYQVTLSNTDLVNKPVLKDISIRFTTPQQPSNESSSHSSARSESCPEGYKHCVNAGPATRQAQLITSDGTFSSQGQLFINPVPGSIDLVVDIKQENPFSLTTQPVSVPLPWQQGFNTVSEIFDYSAMSAFNGYPVIELTYPAIIMLKYDPTKLFGRDPSTLRIAYYDEERGRWVTLQNNTVVKPEENLIANITTKMSYYTVVYPRGGSFVAVAGARTGGKCTTYRVKPGDSLWSIASRQLGSGSRYREIVSNNKLKYPSISPSTLHPGWILRLGC